MTTETPTNTPRLSRQLDQVKSIMEDGKWRTLTEIRDQIDETVSTQSISARLRDLRKNKFGGFKVDRRVVEGGEGLYEYRVDFNAVNPALLKSQPAPRNLPSLAQVSKVTSRLAALGDVAASGLGSDTSVYQEVILAMEWAAGVPIDESRTTYAPAWLSHIIQEYGRA